MEEARINKFSHALFWVAAIEATVISAVGIAAVMSWIPPSTSNPSEKIVFTTPPGKPPTALVEGQARGRVR